MRRLIDILAAVLGGVALAPVMLTVALLIRWRMGSPVLFRQRRSGLHGQEFSILKFRTMPPPAYPGQPDSERQTLLGNTLRTLSLDELPQLWNVLRGHMSLIGPRPTLPEQVARYNQRQLGRLAVRPGLTGWAQVQGRNSLSWPERIELDLWYIAHRSLRLDLRILVLTVGNLVRPRGVLGAGGVNPEFTSSTASEGPASTDGGVPHFLATQPTEPIRVVVPGPPGRGVGLVANRRRGGR